MHFDSITKTNVKDARAAIQAKLDELQAECGLTVTLGSITYEPDGSGLTSRITAKPDMDEAEIEAKAKRDCARLAPRYGLPEDVYGTILNVRTKRLMVVGIDPKRPKNALLLKDMDTGESRIGPIDLYTLYKTTA